MVVAVRTEGARAYIGRPCVSAMRESVYARHGTKRERVWSREKEEGPRERKRETEKERVKERQSEKGRGRKRRKRETKVTREGKRRRGRIRRALFSRVITGEA